MNFWWASQGKNYETAIPNGTLWSCPTGGLTPRILSERRMLKDMVRGDVVFHYARGYLRAVSEVREPWVAAARPEDYPKIRETDWDVGWLVLVSPIRGSIAIPFEELSSYIRSGDHGPLDKNGRPRQKYVSSLSRAEGEALLERIGELDLAPGPNGPDVAGWSGATDAASTTLRRLEQNALRDHLLAGRAYAPCALCGKTLPRDVLLAAHILPRRLLDSSERSDFANTAMLACALGCDVLFERGYIFVDESGRIQGSAVPRAGDLVDVVDSIVGRECSAYHAGTAGKFAARTALALA